MSVRNWLGNCVDGLNARDPVKENVLRPVSHTIDAYLLDLKDSAVMPYVYAHVTLALHKAHNVGDDDLFLF